MDGVPSWARKGARVVCVDAGPSPTQNVPLEMDNRQRLVEGGEYVIAEVLGDYYWPATGHTGAGVRLVGVARSGKLNRPYGIHRFRPIVTLEDDLKAHFSQYLNSPAPVTTNEREQA